MDPLSISAAAAGLLTIFVQAVRLIKQTAEKMKNAKTLLIKLLHQAERMRLLLEQVRSVSLQLGGRNSLFLSFNESACKATVKELHILVEQIAKTRTFIALKFLVSQSTVNQLLQRLRDYEQEFVTLLLSIAAESTLRTEAEVKNMHERAISQAKVVTVFESAPDESSPQNSGPSQGPARLHVWLGSMVRGQFGPEYLQQRDALSDAAYSGRWDELFEILESAEKKYLEPWVNCIRLNEDPSRASGWTPLHQAVYMCASKDEINQLLSFGAFRTTRTFRTDPEEFPHPDMTPIEMARYFGYSHMYDVLSPVIRHNLPARTLESLQAMFHGIIRADMGGEAERLQLRLPELAPLTELEVPQMWFPLGLSKEHHNPQGYLYRLDGRELLVKSHGLHAPDEFRLYRVSETHVSEIEEAITFNA